MTPSDPRVFFASERTLLAWVRTGIAIVGLGFIVSRFGLFLWLVSAQSAGHGQHADLASSNALGIFFVVVGAMSIAGATVQHSRFIATLPEIDRPASYSRVWSIWLASFVSVASFVLAAYLALTLR